MESVPGTQRYSYRWIILITAFIAGMAGPVALFAMPPLSAVLFFAMLIPLALGAGDPVIIPAVFALATGLPVIVISYFLVRAWGSVKVIFRKSVLLRSGSGERLLRFS
jgi:hypothetical protein